MGTQEAGRNSTEIFGLVKTKNEKKQNFFQFRREMVVFNQDSRS
jgi:hypothetical protein